MRDEDITTSEIQVAPITTIDGFSLPESSEIVISEQYHSSVKLQ